MAHIYFKMKVQIRIHIPYQVGKTFLSIAAGYGRVDIMNHLFQHGAYVDHPNAVCN